MRRRCVGVALPTTWVVGAPLAGHVALLVCVVGNIHGARCRNEDKQDGDANEESKHAAAVHERAVVVMRFCVLFISGIGGIGGEEAEDLQKDKELAHHV